MKNMLFVLLFGITASQLPAQTLPPLAQALYNETYNADVNRGLYAVNSGAQFFSSPDSSSFYLRWFPPNTPPNSVPLIVTLHGSDGNVFNEFFLWHPYAVANNCGIVAVQWFHGVAAVPPNDYSQDTAIYNTIESALTDISYPSGKALLHGFSRGSARSYAINLYDILSGHNYFCTTISNAGSAEPNYPIHIAIDNNVYGTTPFAGKHWALYCGGLDSGILSNCQAMNTTQNWLTAKGASVDMFIQDANAPHGGFHLNPANVDSVMTYYLQCYYGTSALHEIQAHQQAVVFPNPARGGFSVKIPSAQMNSNWHIELYDSAGRMAYRRPLRDAVVHLRQISPGTYSYIIYNGTLAHSRGKIIVLGE